MDSGVIGGQMGVTKTCASLRRWSDVGLSRLDLLPSCRASGRPPGTTQPHEVAKTMPMPVVAVARCDATAVGLSVGVRGDPFHRREARDRVGRDATGVGAAC